MKDQKTSYGAKGKLSLVQQICILDVNHHSFEKTGPIRLAPVGLTAGCLAGWLAHKMWQDV